MTAQVDFNEAARKVEVFISALQELKAMMKSLNDTPTLKGMDAAVRNGLNSALSAVTASGPDMVNAFLKIGQNAGAALGKGTESGVAKATSQVKQAIVGHHTALAASVAEGSKRLEAAAANQATAMGSAFLKALTQQQAINEAALKAKTPISAELLLGINPNSAAAATENAKRAVAGSFDSLMNFTSTKEAERRARAQEDHQKEQINHQRVIDARHKHYGAELALERAHAAAMADARREIAKQLLANSAMMKWNTPLQGSRALPTGAAGKDAFNPVLDAHKAEGMAELRAYFKEMESAAAAASQVVSRALMLDNGVVRQATKQAQGAVKVHFDALGMEIRKGAKTAEQAAAEAAAATQRALSLGAMTTSVASPARAAQRVAGTTDAFGTFRPLSAPAQVPSAVEAANSSKAIKDATKAAQEAHPHFAKTVTSLNDMHSAARGVASGFNAMWLTWGSLVPLLAGAAVSNAFVQTVKQGAALNDTFERLRVLGGESAQAVASLNAQMLELARSGPVAPQEIAEAMKTLRLAGLDAAEVAASIKDVLNFSIAGDTSLTQAAEAITTIGTAFNIAAADYSYISDTVAKAAAESKASIESMSEAMKTASVVHQQYGVSLEDTAVGLSLLANAGIQGSAAGTALRNMYVDLAGRTDKVSAKLKQLGVEALDPLTGKMRSQAEIFKQLISGLQKYETAAGATKALQEIFSERSSKQAIALYNAMTMAAKKSGADIATAYDDLLEKVTNAGGTAALAAAELSLTPLRQMESVKSTLQSTLVEVFNSLQPYILQLSSDLKSLFSSAEFKGTLQELVTGVGELTKFLFEHGKAIAYVVIGYQGLKAVASFVTAMGTAYAAMSAQVVAGTTAMGLATRAATAANPLMLALAAAVSAAASAWAVYTMWAGKGAQTTAPAAQDRDALLKNLEAEHKRLREINAARERGIDLADYLATKQAKTVISSDSGDVVKAREALKDAERFADSRIKGTGAAAAAQQRVSSAQASLARALEVQAAKDRAIASLQAGIRDFGNTTGRTERYKAEEDARRRAEMFKGSGLPDPDNSKGAKDRIDAIKVNHFDELKQIEKRYNDEVSTIKSAEQNKQTLLKASHEAKLIDTGEFYARELALAAEAERSLLARAESSASAAAKAIEVGRDAVTSKFQSWVSENQSKDGFADRYLSEWERVSAELAKLDSEYESLVSKLANDKKTIGDNAATRMTLQAIKAEGAVKALAKETEDFWKAEATSRAAAQRATAAEDMLRYASPEAAAYISAATQEQERLTKAMLDNDKAVELAEVSLLAYAAALEMEWQVSKEQTAQLGLMADALSELKKRRDALAGKAPEMVSEAGDRALTKFKKDEKAQLIKGVADAIETGLFEGGTAGKKKLRDLIVAELRKPISLIIQAVVNPMMGALLGSMGLGTAAAGQVGGSMLGSAASSMGSSALGTASNLSSAYSALSNGVSSAVSAGFDKLVTNGVGEKLGLSYYNGTGYETTGMGAQLGSYAGMAGNALAGYGLQKAISGGYKTGESGIVDAITVAASAYFGPIAGVAAGVFNRAFGRKLADQGLQGQFGGDAGFTGENFQFYKGGWFRSDKTKTSALDADMQSGLADQFNAIRVQTALMATALGDTGQSVADFTSSIKVSFNGLTEAQIGEKLTETFTGIANDLAKTVLGDSAFAKEGEAASQTLQRLSTSLTTVNATFDTLGFSLEAVSLDGADAASDFIDLIGGVEAFAAATAGYYANFYTETERQGIATEQLATQLGKLGQTLPTTRDGFRALIEAAEKAGDNALLAGLLNLQDEFAALVPAAEDAAAAVASAISSLKDETKRLQRDLIVATGRDVRAYDTLYMTSAERSIYDYNQSLRDQISAANAATQASEAAAEAARARAEAVAQERDGLNRQLLEATGDTAAIRALEIAALDASNRAIQTHVWAIEDAKAAYEKATDAAQAAYNTLERSVDAERTKLTTTYNAEKDTISARLKAQQVGYQAQITAAQAAADKIRDIASALAAAVDKVKVDSPALNRLAYDSARGVISTRNIDDPRLKAALDAVSGDNKQFYGTFEAYAFDQAVTSANIKSMDATAQSQLSAAEALINSMKASDTLSQALADAELAALEEKHQEDLAKLQEQLDNGKAQLDALMGIDNSVLSVADAVAALGGAISAAYAAQSAQIAASSAAQSTVSSGSAETFVQSDDQAAYRALIDAQGKALNDAKGSAAFWESIGVDGAKGAALAASDRAAVAAGRYDRVGAADVLGLDGKAVNDAIYKYAVASNPLLFDSSAGAALSNAGSGYVPPGLREELLKTLGIPGFDVGINRVPRDMLAQIHEGEAVVPAQFNPYNPGASAPGNSEVVAELRRLNERMARIEATNAATAGHTAATDRKLARVIRNDAMVTEAATA